MQDAFELLRPRSHGACERSVEHLIHLPAISVDRICNEAPSLVDCRQRRNRCLIELLHLLGNLFDGLERAADVVLNRAEDRVEHVTTEDDAMRRIGFLISAYCADIRLAFAENRR